MRIINSRLVVDGDATVDGALVIEQGAAVHFNGLLNDGSHPFPVTSRGLLQFGGKKLQRITGPLSGDGVLRIAAPAQVTLASHNGFNGTIQIDAGALLTLSGTLGCGSFSGDILNDGILAFASSAHQTLAGNLIGGGELRLEGGTLALGEGKAVPSSCVALTHPAQNPNRYPDGYRR